MTVLAGWTWDEGAVASCVSPWLLVAAVVVVLVVLGLGAAVTLRAAR